ncbi:MAG: hypothetical protein U0935_08940 [Pirellulales bacterium]
MKTPYTLNVDLTLLGPILTVGGETAAPGIDSPMSRDRHGRWMLPFSLVKGKVLDAITQLKTSDFALNQRLQRYLPQNDELREWLGIPSEEGTFDPERGRWHFSDFHTTAPGNPDHIIERIEIAPESGAAADRMLRMVQAPFGYGEPVEFSGTVEFVASEEEAQRMAQLLDAALRWTPAYGACRTIGYGRTQAVTTRLVPTAIRSCGVPLPSTQLSLELALDRPLCLVGRKHVQNHFESLETISGTVLKGAVARMMQERSGAKGHDVSAVTGDYPGLRKYFAVLRFSEARPRRKGATTRRVEPPLSLVISPTRQEEDQPFCDAALEPQPRLIRNAAPAFQPDWKTNDADAVKQAFGWENLPRQQRTRTAIDPVRGRAADQQLFSYNMVLPDCTDRQGNKHEFVWDACIGLEDVDSQDHAAVRQELAELLQHGITGIGKTRAVANVTWASPLPPAVSSRPVAAGLVVVTLQTECLMTRPETLQQMTSTNPVETAYREYWRDISHGSLELVRYFARQSLYGGFVSQRARADRYEPFLLTDRGSVFVLSLADPTQARPLLAAWMQSGLPNATWLATRYAPDGTPLWRRCPYLRENGYGEIALDLACHTTHRFPPDQPTTGAAS